MVDETKASPADKTETAPMQNWRELQETSKAKLEDLMQSTEAKQGSFKRIVPLNEQVAVAIVETKQGAKDQQALEHEVKLLQILAENDLPALRTHGDVYEIKPGSYAVLMDWLPDTKLLDGKDPDGVNIILTGMLLGVKIPSGEGWVMHLDRIKKEITEKMNDPNIDLNDIKQQAQILQQNFTKLLDTLQRNNIVIGDLQLLVSPKGEITIIDPIDVLRVTAGQTANQKNWVDIVDPSKPTSQDFKDTTLRSKKMLEAGRDFCATIARTIETNPQALPAIVASPPRTKSFTPGFSAGGGDLRKQLLQGKKGMGMGMGEEFPTAKQQSIVPRKPFGK